MNRSRIFCIADASKEGLTSILGALRWLEKDQLIVQVVLVSFLATLPEKDFPSLGPTSLFILMQEERELLGLMETHFARMNVPYHLDLVTIPNWKNILKRIEEGSQALVIAQGTFAGIWRGRCRRFGWSSPISHRLDNCPIMLSNPYLPGVPRNC